MPSLSSARETVVLKSMGLRELAPVFNLIQDGSAQGHFTPLYREPRFMAGLGLQLFTLLLGRMRLPDRVWRRAKASVLMVYGRFAGFVILCQQHDGCEIYMCALLPQFRGQGLGRWMLKQALSRQVPAGQSVAAECLPASLSMMAVLRSLGFATAPLAHATVARRFSALWPGPGGLASPLPD